MLLLQLCDSSMTLAGRVERSAGNGGFPPFLPSFRDLADGLPAAARAASVTPARLCDGLYDALGAARAAGFSAAEGR